MQRMGSPIVAADKSKGFSETMNLGSTMAGSAINTTQLSGTAKYKFSQTHTSPFRDTVARGMVTGVGLLGK